MADWMWHTFIVRDGQFKRDCDIKDTLMKSEQVACLCLTVLRIEQHEMNR